jgi:hypothetical protein
MDGETRRGEVGQLPGEQRHRPPGRDHRVGEHVAHRSPDVVGRRARAVGEHVGDELLDPAVEQRLEVEPAGPVLRADDDPAPGVDGTQPVGGRCQPPMHRVLGEPNNIAVVKPAGRCDRTRGAALTCRVLSGA